jgi:hypothetical protein
MFSLYVRNCPEITKEPCRMSDFADHLPRRYFVDQVGRRVLIGLTVEETFEFETLDVPWKDGVPTTTRKKRWLELYSKHDQAWRQWISKNYPDRRESLAPRI